MGLGRKIVEEAAEERQAGVCCVYAADEPGR